MKSWSPSGQQGARIVRRGWMLGALSLVCLAGVSRADLPAVVTESNLRMVILGQTHSFTSAEIESMDLNKDGKVDVADLVAYVTTLGARPDGASFETSESTVDEGGTVRLFMTLAAGYTGSVYYTITGEAGCGSDYDAPAGSSCPVTSGVVPFNGTDAQVVIDIGNDLAVENVERLVVTLIPAAGYALGPRQQHTVFIIDDDEVWHAAINVDGLKYTLPIEIARSDSGVQVVLRSDGTMGLPVGDFASSINPIVTDSSFYAKFGPFQMAAGDTLVGVSLERELEFTSQSVQPGVRIQGQYHESFSGTGNAVQFTQVGSEAVRGSFDMGRGVPQVPVVSVELSDAP